MRPWTVTLTLDFGRRILKWAYLRNGGADCHGTKGMWVDRMQDPKVTLTLFFQGQILKNCFWGMGGLIDIKVKGYESIGCWTHYMTLNFDLTHDLDLGFSRSIIKKLYLWNGMAYWHGMKRMWVGRMLDLLSWLCDLEGWPWPWILKVKFWIAKS